MDAEWEPLSLWNTWLAYLGLPKLSQYFYDGLLVFWQWWQWTLPWPWPHLNPWPQPQRQSHLQLTVKVRVTISWDIKGLFELILCSFVDASSIIGKDDSLKIWFLE